MTDPEKAPTHGIDRLQAVLPNPFIVSAETRGDEPQVSSPIQILGFNESSSQPFEYANPNLPLADNAAGLLAAYIPDFGGGLPQPIPILDYDDQPQTPLQSEPPSSKFDLEDGAVASSKVTPQLRGIGLIGAVFNVLSKQLGTEYSTAELMLAAQQLIDISKAEHVGIPYKDIAERAGYYSWDLVRAFTSHQWQIAEVETNRMDHCDVDEFAPESYETAKLLLQGRNERTWEF
jgi:hypothetical protein